jgi:hypothetical protein
MKAAQAMEKSTKANDRIRHDNIGVLLDRYRSFLTRVRNQAAFTAALGKVHMEEALFDATQAFKESSDAADSHRYADTYAFVVIQQAIADVTQGRTSEEQKEIKKKVREAIKLLDQAAEHALDERDYNALPYVQSHKELGDAVLRWLETLL